MNPTHTDYQETMTHLLAVSGCDSDKELASRGHTDQAQSILWIIGPQLTIESRRSIQDWIIAVRHLVNCMLVSPKESGQIRFVVQHTRLACHERVKESKAKVVWEWVKG